MFNILNLMLMRNYFSKLGTQVPWRTSQSRGATLALPLRYLSALLILLTLSIGQSWATEIFSWTVSSALAKNATETATGGTVKCTGSAMGSETPSSSGFFKFNSSTQLTFTLSSGTFAAGDVISFTFTSAGNNKTVGVEIQETSPVTQLTETVAAKGTSVTKTYTVAASDGIQGQNKFSIKRVDSNFSFKSVTVTSSSGETPVCPSGLTISGTQAYTEGDKITLNAALEAGNGTITYQWYKGSVAAGNAISGATAAKYEKSSCTTADAGDYFCVASKTSCSDAVNASAYAVTVAADTKCFNMPAITSTPANIGAIAVTGGALADVGSGKTLKMQSTGIGFGNGNAARLQVTLTSASIVTGTKITVYFNNASSDGSGIGLYNENYEHQVINETGVTGSGSFSHTFTAEEAANYSDVFLIDRNNTGKGIIVGSITVEDCGPAVVKHTITLNYNDGVTPNGSLLVVDGTAATQPADPERGKYTFLGWNNGASAYNWATPVTADLTLTAQWQDPWTITFDADGGSAVADITVKHNTKAEKPADPTYAGHDFNGWYYGDPEVAFDWDANVTQNYALKAHWIAEVAKYDIEYYDGETKIGTEEQVRADQHPTAAGISTDKLLYSFDGWFLNSALTGDPVALNTVTPSEGLKLYGKWTKVYATSYDMEAYAVSDGASLATLLENLTAAGYAYTNVNGIDYGHTHNYIYDGMKYKTNDGDLSFNVNAGKLVIVKTGNLPANALTMYINGVADPTVFVGANEAVETHVNNYFYSEAEALYRLDIQASKGTCAIKAVTITDPYEVSFNPNGGDPVAPQYGHPAVTLPDASNGTKSLLGWFDAATGGNKIGDVGDPYTPTANIELFAQWENVSTDARLASIEFSAVGTLSPAFDPEVTNYTYTMPYGTAAVPTITSATAVNTNAQSPIIGGAAATWGNAQTVKGVAQSGDEMTYTITMQIAPKDGVSIIKAIATATGNLDITDENLTGLYKGAAHSYTSGSYKFDAKRYFMVQLEDGKNFQAGDIVEINVSTVNDATGFAIFSDIVDGDFASATLIIDTHVDSDDASKVSTGINKVTLPGSYAGSNKLYVARASSGEQSDKHLNAGINQVEVKRPMDPVMTAIKFNDTDVEVASTTVAATLPNGTNLGSMTVDPTIWWNGAGTAVAANTWEWDVPNTYTVTDKDGDATVYTITLTEDVLKHTVSFNTHGGSTIDPVQVVDGQQLEAAPADPEKEDYIFQGWAEAEDGDIVDVTSFTISAGKEFHAVWVSDGAIKLLDGATVNHTNFITGVTADETVEFMGNTVNYAKFSGTVSGVNGVKDLTRVIAYNATTNKTKIRISAHNNSTSGRNILVKGLVEGANEAVDLANIVLGNKEDVVSDWIEFDNAANRTIYIMVSSSAGDVYFTQVKVIESGETPMKQFGEVGYSLNLNKGRFFGLASTDLAFEGLNARLSGDYTALNSGYAKLNATSMSFTLAAPALLTVTTNNSKTYYVTKGAAGTDNETALKGASEFNLTAGTWFITGGSDEVQITNIEFETPKCVTPVITEQPSSRVDFATSDNLTATVTVVETPSDGGTLSYQWYNAADNSEVTGATSATLTTTEPGTYYVIITNSQEGYQDALIQSDNATLKYRKADDATLIALTYGAENTAIALVDGVTDYRVTLPEDATVVPALTATPTMAAYGAKADVTNADAFEEYEAVSSVLVTAENGTTTQTYTVTFVVKHPYAAIENVTGNTVWDWRGTVNQQIDDVANKGTVIANYIDGDNFEKIEGQEGAYARRTQNDGVYQGNYLHFNTTVAGKVKFYFRAPSEDNVCTITVKNGSRTVVAGSRGNSLGWSDEVYVTGDVVVEIKNVKKDGTLGQGRIQQIIFTAVTPDYTRDLTEGRYGTICLPNGGIMVGAELFEIAYYGETTKKIFLDNVPSGEMVAGRPYIFYPNKGVSQLAVFYTDEANAEAGNHNGLFGFIGASADVYYNIPDGVGNYILQNNLYREVLAGAQARILSNRAYINLSAISPTEPALAPGRRRISMGIQSEQVATGIGNVQGDEVQSTKVLINGQLFILRGEKMYDATGRLVK